MNRRNFLKYLGLGGLVASVPVITIAGNSAGKSKTIPALPEDFKPVKYEYKALFTAKTEESIFKGDFIKMNGGGAVNCSVMDSDCVGIALTGALKGDVIQIEEDSPPKLKSRRSYV